MKGPYKLKLEKLRFLSAVDMPAQGEGARALLLKRQGNGLQLVAKVAKTVDALGLVFGYAFATSLDGGKTPHIDHQDDAIDPDFLKCAMDFVAGGGATDVNHDGSQDGRVIFAWPLIPEVNKALGIEAAKVGLAVAIKPSAATYKRFQDGELTGFSIEGTGVREEMSQKSLSALLAALDSPEGEAIIQRAIKAQWSVAMIDDLPDSSFLYVEDGGTKDAADKTTPRSLRHFPYRDANGTIDIAHLRDVIGRIPQSSLPATLRDKLQVRAEKLLAKEHSKSLRKQVTLTSIVDGHQHAIDLDDPADYCGDRLSTTYATSDGADISHAHVWTFDATSGAVTIAMDSGHDHAVTDVVPPTVLAAFKLNEQAEDARDAQALLEQVLDGGAGSGAVSVTIAARNSTRLHDPRNPGCVTKETVIMPDAKDTEIANLTKRAERAERIAKMTGPHKSHFDTLTGDDAEAFLAKSHAERETIAVEVAKRATDANEIVYTSKSDGAVYRKRDDQRLVEMAKRFDAQAEAVEKAQIATIAKSHLGTLAGDDDVHEYVIASCRKGGGDAAKLEKVFTAMKGWNALGADAKKAKGFNPNADATGAPDKAMAYVALEKGLVPFCKTNKIEKVWTDGLDAFIQTPEGAALHSAYETAKTQAQN